MKVCVIGNSQVGALFKAAQGNSARQYEHYDFHSILVARNVDIDSIPPGYVEIKNNRLVTTSAKHKINSQSSYYSDTGLDFSQYSAIIVSACGFWAYRNENAHWLFELRLADWPLKADSNIPTPLMVSVGLFEQITYAMQSHTVTMQICEALATSYAGKILVQPWPLPCETILLDQSWKLRRLYGDYACSISQFFFASQYKAIQQYLAQLGEQFTLLPYPDPDWLHSGYTPERFGTSDPWHMNADYGALVLQQAQRLFSNSHFG